MKSNEYQCAKCQSIFQKGWSDEEALGELNEDYPGFKTEDCAIICDDCYKQIPKPMSYEAFKKISRKHQADDWRRMRKDNRLLANLLWRAQRNVYKQLMDCIFYGTPIT